MKNRTLSAILFLLAASLGCHAQTTPVAAPGPPSTAPPPPVKKNPTKADMRGMMWRLDQTMEGQPVIAVGYGMFREDIPWSDEAFKAEHTLVGKLEMISAKNSEEDYALIPYRVRGSYIIAPEMMEVANLDVSGLDDVAIAGRGVLMDRLLVSLSDDQIHQLGTSEGIAASSLKPEQRRLVAGILRPPFTINRLSPTTYKDESGHDRATYSIKEEARITDPLDVTQVHIRAKLEQYGAIVPVTAEGGGIYIGHPEENSGLQIDSNGTEKDVDPPILTPAPNKFKPSNLDGKNWPQPVGISGVWTCREALDQIQKVTGLKLITPKDWSDPIFIGAPSVPCGDVLDALRLALTGTWRRMGSSYLLAWDLRGLGALQQLAQEATAGMTTDIQKQQDKDRDSPNWLTIAEQLPFDPNDPLALSDDQRKRLFGDGAPDRRPIPFSEMTSAQQDAIRAQAKTERVTWRSGGSNEVNIDRPYTEDDIQKATLDPSTKIKVSLDIPGHGWTTTEMWNHAQIQGWNLDNIRRKAAHPDDPSSSNSIPPELLNPVPGPLPGKSYAMMAPPMAAARLNLLSDEMHRHGFTTLFYPALYGGFATFPTTSFPLHPALRGTDGLTAAVEAMKRHAIKVVPYISLLSWRTDDDRAHWLDRHPDWFDVDMLGRTPLEWKAEHPDAETFQPDPSTFAVRDYVRPAEPAVQSRIETLMADLAARKDAAGVLITDWRPPTAQYSRDARPKLGFAVPDRLLAIAKTGVDPVDVPLSWDSFKPHAWSVELPPSQDIEPDPKAFLQEPHAQYLQDVVKQARQRRKDWKLYIDGLDDIHNAGNASALKTALKPDVAFGAIFSNSQGSDAVLLPLWQRALTAKFQGVDGPFRDKLAAMSPMALMVMATRMGGAGAAAKMTVIDARSAPEEITDAMAWILPPGSKPPPLPKPPAAPAPPS